MVIPCGERLPIGISYMKEAVDMRVHKAPVSTPTGRRGQGRKILIVLGLGIAVFALVILGMVAMKHQQGQLKLEIAGYKVSEEAYSWAMYKARNEVLSRHSAAGISPVVWDVRTELGLPQEMVADRAVELLKEFYAVGVLAVDRGYLQDASFEALEEDRQALNQSNRENIASGGIVTGLTNYTLEQYIHYRNAGLRLQFCYDETNPENVVTDQELRLRYEQDKDKFFGLPDSYVLHWIEIWDRPELEPQVEQLRQSAVEAGSLIQALETDSQLKSYFCDVSFDGRQYATYEQEYSLLLSYAGELNTGEISQVICENGCIWLVECVERKENGYEDLDSVASVVLAAIREEHYDALVAQLAGQINAEYDTEALYRYTARQLG